MKLRTHYRSDPLAATARISAPRNWSALLCMAWITLWAGAIGAALGAGGIVGVATLDRDGVAIGLMLLIISAGIFLGINQGLRYECDWLLFGYELVRVTDQAIVVERVPRGRRAIPVGSRRLEDVKRVFVAERMQWFPFAKAVEMRGQPRTWLTVVARDATEDLQFGLSLGAEEAQQLASFLTDEIEARSPCGLKNAGGSGSASGPGGASNPSSF